MNKLYKLALPSKAKIGEDFNLLLALTEKEFKTQYRNALLGILWVFVNPILRVLVVGFVFSFFFDIENYFIFLFVGFLPWTSFSQSVNKATKSFVGERSLLHKTNFSKFLIPFSMVLSKFIQLGMLLVVSFITMAIFGLLEGAKPILLIPAYMWLFTFSLALSLLTSTLNVFYRDVEFLIQSLLGIWFYATPILYSLNLIPKNIRNLYTINPLTSVFEMFRVGFFGQGYLKENVLMINLAITVTLVIFSSYIYVKKNKYFVDQL